MGHFSFFIYILSSLHICRLFSSHLNMRLKFKGWPQDPSIIQANIIYYTHINLLNFVLYIKVFEGDAFNAIFLKSRYMPIFCELLIQLTSIRLKSMTSVICNKFIGWFVKQEFSATDTYTSRRTCQWSSLLRMLNFTSYAGVSNIYLTASVPLLKIFWILLQSERWKMLNLVICVTKNYKKNIHGVIVQLQNLYKRDAFSPRKVARFFCGITLAFSSALHRELILFFIHACSQIQQFSTSWVSYVVKT